MTRALRLSATLVAAALMLTGCGRAKEQARRQPVRLTIYLPCVIGGPLQKVAAAYEAGHPGVELAPQTYKPFETLSPPKEGSAVAITVGELEMKSLVRAGLADEGGVRTFATNTSPLAVVAAAEGAPGVKQVSDLARPSVKRIFLEDPEKSSLGARAVEGFQKLGLWEKLKPKAVSPPAGVMVLGELLAGKADAAVVFKGCLFGEGGEGGQPPKTIRVVGELPPGLYRPIPYQVAAIKAGTRPEVAQGFADFLVSEKGSEALRGAGLTPTGRP